MDTATRPRVTRRTFPGLRGGRPLLRAYGFAPRDGDLYPLESEVIRRTRLEPPDALIDPAQAGWEWALGHARLEDCWVAISLTGATPEDRRRESRNVTSSIMRTAARLGLRLLTQHLNDTLYVYVTDKP